MFCRFGKSCKTIILLSSVLLLCTLLFFSRSTFQASPSASSDSVHIYPINVSLWIDGMTRTKKEVYISRSSKGDTSINSKSSATSSSSKSGSTANRREKESGLGNTTRLSCNNLTYTGKPSLCQSDISFFTRQQILDGLRSKWLYFVGDSQTCGMVQALLMQLDEQQNHPHDNFVWYNVTGQDPVYDTSGSTVEGGVPIWSSVKNRLDIG